VIQPIRGYAAEQLNALGETVRAGTAHAVHYLQLADAIGPVLERTGRRVDLQRFLEEAENLRAAVEFALAEGNRELALDLVSACAPWWRETNQTTEGRHSVQAALALAGETAPMPSRARALDARATL
jgi:predicted ATPase